ncbi:MAG: hypothetical protein AAB947_00910 [Patescibacteria group bacterium]
MRGVWTTDTGGSVLAGYKVFRNGMQVATTSTPSFSHTALTASTTYSFTVSAFDTARECERVLDFHIEDDVAFFIKYIRYNYRKSIQWLGAFPTCIHSGDHNRKRHRRRPIQD